MGGAYRYRQMRRLYVVMDDDLPCMPSNSIRTIGGGNLEHLTPN